MLYDFKCKKCGHVEVDVLVKKVDEDVICENCNNKMEKQMPLTTFKMTSHEISDYKKKYGNNNLPPNYKPTGGAYFYPPEH